MNNYVNSCSSLYTQTSLYSGSAWDCNYLDSPTCFLHQYSEYQPDFNLDNEYVKQHLTVINLLSISILEIEFEVEYFQMLTQVSPRQIRN